LFNLRAGLLKMRGQKLRTSLFIIFTSILILTIIKISFSKKIKRKEVNITSMSTPDTKKLS